MRQWADNVATTLFPHQIVFVSHFLCIVITNGFPDVSTHVHSFHERGSTGLLFSSPMCLASGFSPTRRPRARSVEFVAFCALSMGIAWKQLGLRFCKESGQKYTLVKNCKAGMHKRPFPVSKKTLLWRIARLVYTRDCYPWAAADENCQRKNYEGHGLTWLQSDNPMLCRRRLRIACQSIIKIYRSRRGVHDGETPTKKFPEFLELKRRQLASALVKRTTSRTNVKTSRLRGDSRNTKRQLNASLTKCMRVSVCCTIKQIIYGTERHSFIVLVLKSVCGSHHFAAEKKNC